MDKSRTKRAVKETATIIGIMLFFAAVSLAFGALVVWLGSISILLMVIFVVLSLLAFTFTMAYVTDFDGEPDHLPLD